ncbi:MAG: hypothetical protein EOP22_07005 [Hyphomicrobiales bacterium]|nr:MAG: hypothetical protein EOP22_07005 [Hyphomicrobiales bacterium]
MIGSVMAPTPGESDLALAHLTQCLRAQLAGAAAPEPPPAGVADLAVSIALSAKLPSLAGRYLDVTGQRSAALAQYAAATMSRNAEACREISSVSRALTARNIDFITIKGPLQHFDLYGSYFVRRSSDIDLVVRRADFATAKSSISDLGYLLSTVSYWWEAVLGEVHFERAEPVRGAIDLHWHTHQPGVPSVRSETVFFKRTANAILDGQQIPILDRDGTRLLIVISIAKALYNREPSAAYICDLFQSLIPASPGAINSFLTDADRQGVGGHAAIALRLVKAMFGDAFPYDPASAPVLTSWSSDDLLRMAFLPRAESTAWPRRRELVWQFCGRSPLRYAQEFALIGLSEIVRRIFERGTARAAHRD